jgi:hypothetical protein
MKMKKTLSIGKWNRNEKGIDLTRHLSGNERVSLLEDLRLEMSKVTHDEYPPRLRSILEIAKR